MGFNYRVLWDEIDSDPLGRGYSGMTDVQITTDLNTLYRERNRELMAGTEVLNAVKKSEFVSLSSASRQLVWDMLHLGNLNPFGVEATLFVDIFGSSSSTIATLQALRKELISRAAELGLGTVATGQIIKAKAQFGG